LDLMNIMLGEGMSSRLFSEIRDNLGLTYNISSYVDYLLDTGAVSVAASVEPEDLPVTIEAILKQLALMKEPVPADEFERAKSLARGRLLLRMEDTRSVTGWMGGQEIHTGTIMTVEEVVRKIDAVTLEQVQKVACNLMTTEALRMAVVGPVKDIKGLEEFLKL
ncbi:MAG: insulinase family protein, partial [Dehalococcoidales bacterium]|nr:insulinase family protein [Dehalococcoidales bacterium]